MAFARCAENIRYLPTPRHTGSWIEETRGGSGRRHVIQKVAPHIILVGPSSADELPISGFLGKVNVKAVYQPPLQRLNRFNRYSVWCRGPPASKFSKNFDAHRRNRYEVLEQRKR